MAKSVSKIAYLDGIRGVAAFLVFVHHFLLAFYSAYYTFDMNASNLNGLEVKYGKSLFSVLSNGNFCVCVFFVLSGLVLSRKYFLTNQFDVIVSGAQRRFLRLYIPVAATMLISFTLLKLNLYFNGPVSTIAHSEWWFGGQWVIPNPLEKLWICLKVGTMFQGDSTFDTSLWTMGIELTGSMFVFAFLAFTHNVKNRFACILLVLLYCKFTEQTLIGAFVLGISLNYVERYVATLSRHLVPGIIAFALFLFSLVLGSLPTNGVVVGTIFEHVHPPFSDHYNWFHILGAYFLVLSFVLSPVQQRVISLRLFRFLGYVSFCLYLLHPLIIGSFSSYLFLKIYPRLDYNHAVPVVFLLTAPVCLLLSWIMTKCVDDPGIRFSKYVYNRWIKKKTVPQEATLPINEEPVKYN